MIRAADVLLTCDLAEDTDDAGKILAIEIIQDWLSATGTGRGLKRIDQHAGGNKAMSAAVYGGAFDHFDHEEFFRIVSTAPWKFPEHMRLLIQKQNQQIFSLYRFPSPWTLRHSRLDGHARGTDEEEGSMRELEQAPARVRHRAEPQI